MAVIVREYGKGNFYNTVRPDNTVLSDIKVNTLSETQLDYSLALPSGKYTLSQSGRFDVSLFSIAPKTAVDVLASPLFLTKAVVNSITLYGDGILLETKQFSPSISGYDVVEMDTNVVVNNRIYAGHNVIYSSSDVGSTNNDTVYGYTGYLTYYANHPLIKDRSDLIYGGSGGIDTVVFSSKSSNFTIRAASNLYDDITEKSTLSGFMVTDTTKKVNTVQASNVERLSFIDTNIALDIGSTQTAGSGYMLYKAAFNRTPDAGGLGYWISKMDGGMSYSDVAKNFVTSTEFKTAFGGSNPSVNTLVTKLYNNVLNRTPDAGGLTFWQDKLNTGWSTADVLGFFSTSGENVTNVTPLIANGISYTQFVG